MISVLHLTSSFGLGGGAETNLARLVCNMESSRFRDTVVTMTDVPTRDYDLLALRLGAVGVGMHSLGMRSGVPDPLGAARLYRIIRQVRPHILMTWMYHADFLGLLIGKLTNVPSIVWSLQCSNLPDDVRMLTLVRHALSTPIPLSEINHRQLLLGTSVS